jgi:CHAT domain-containing protein/tetratricopeptide (TPR) repeat protein
MYRRVALASVVAFGACLLAWCPASGQVRPPALSSGSVTEQEIRGGQTHSYAVVVRKGEFIHVIAEQKGADIELTLKAADGRELFRSDLPNGSYGPESVLALAEEDGEYRVEVVIRNATAPPGRYAIRLAALRPAQAGDADQIAAELSTVEAQRLRRDRTEGSRRAAIAKLESAMPYFERSQDLYRQALTLNTIGVTRAELGDFRGALDCYGRALALFRRAGDSYGETTAVNNAGGAYDVVGDPPKALEHYRLSLELARRLNNRLGEAVALNNISTVYNNSAEWSQSIEFTNQALAGFRSLGDRRREATALSNLGTSYNFLGEPARALLYLDQAVTIYREVNDRAGESASTASMAYAYSVLGQPAEAVNHYERAVELARAAGDRRGEGVRLYQLGRAQAGMGQREQALSRYQESLRLLQDSGDLRESAGVIGNIAEIYRSNARRDEAREKYRQALDIFRAVGDRNSIARMLAGLARVERDDGNFDEARRQIEAALGAIEEVRTLAGGGESRASYFASNQQAYQFDIDLLMHQGQRALAFETSERARARSLLDMLSESRTGLREGADPELLARERTTQQLLSAKSERLMQMSGRKGYESQEAALKDDLGRLETEYAQIEQVIRAKSPHYAALTQPKPASLQEIQREVLDGRTLLLEYSLGDERSYLWAVERDSIEAYELPGRAAIEQAVLTVIELVTARGTAARAELPNDRAARIATADAALPAALAKLSGIILSPAAERLGDRSLAIVADGALQSLPFAMLPEPRGNEPLVARHEVVLLPSASVVAELRRENAGRTRAPNVVAVLADPVFDPADARLTSKAAPKFARPSSSGDATAGDDLRLLEHLANTPEGSAQEAKMVIPRLPYTREEADAIVKVAGAAHSLEALDSSASRDTAISGKLAQYRYVHFATHGFLDAERTGLSALVLSLVDGGKQPQDGFLRVNDIYNMRLSADLVVLSACQTGLGKEVRGEGVMGLTRAFLYAGAARVIVSLWNVNDRATAELMAGLYRGMLRQGKTPAAALRAAQLELRKQKRWESPYYWAAFVQHGEWK